MSRARILVGVVLLLAWTPSLAHAQPQETGMVISGTFGGTTLEGAPGSLPPGGTALWSAARVAIGRGVGFAHVSGESELSWAGVARGRRQTFDATPHEVQERRSDLLWSFLGGIELWEPHRIGSIHFVGGVSYVKPLVQSTRLTYNQATRGFDDPTPTAAGYGHGWALSGGLDLMAAIGGFAAGPSFRWHDYRSNAGPWGAAPARSISVGMTVGYRF